MYFPANTNKNSKNIINKNVLVGNLPPQFLMNETEEQNYKAILKRQADEKPFTLIKKKNVNATIIKINHLRASADEAIKFKEYMLVLIHQGHKDFIIDFSNCEFMDSTFLGAVILFTKKLNAGDGSLVLVADPNKLKVLHALIELKKILPVFSSLDEASKEYSIDVT